MFSECKNKQTNRNEGKWQGGKEKDKNAKMTSKQLRMKCQKISAWMWFLNTFLKHFRAKMKPNALKTRRLANQVKLSPWFHARVHLMCFLDG